MKDVIFRRNDLLRTTREFFCERGYVEVETPALMKTSPPDPNIDPLEVMVGGQGPLYLHTSPEVGMKKMLGLGLESIFQISKVFRVEELEDLHSVEFTMLEWYTKGTYETTMREAEEFILSCMEDVSGEIKAGFELPWRRYELEDICYKITGINPFIHDRDGLFDAMLLKGFGGIDDKDGWNELFFKLFIQEVEPALSRDAPYFITDWPDTISAMAQRKGKRKVERFELYIHGLEIANGYTELLDRAQQEQCFLQDNECRRLAGKKTFPLDYDFLDCLPGIQGPVSGVSVGMDRLLMVLLGKKRIRDVLPFYFTV